LDAPRAPAVRAQVASRRRRASDDCAPRPDFAPRARQLAESLDPPRTGALGELVRARSASQRMSYPDDCERPGVEWSRSPEGWALSEPSLPSATCPRRV